MGHFACEQDLNIYFSFNYYRSIKWWERRHSKVKQGKAEREREKKRGAATTTKCSVGTELYVVVKNGYS